MAGCAVNRMAVPARRARSSSSIRSSRVCGKMLGTAAITPSPLVLLFCGNCGNCANCRPEKFQQQQLLSGSYPNQNLQFCGNCGKCVKCRPELVLSQSFPPSAQGGAHPTQQGQFVVPVPAAHPTKSPSQVTVLASHPTQQFQITVPAYTQFSLSPFSTTMVPSSQAVSFGFGNYANYGHGITVPGAGNLLTGTTVLRAPTFSFQPSPPFAQQHGVGASLSLPFPFTPPSQAQIGFVSGLPSYFWNQSQNTALARTSHPPGTARGHLPASQTQTGTDASIPASPSSVQSVQPLPPFQISAKPAVVLNSEHYYQEAKLNLVKAPFTRSRVVPTSSEYRILSEMIDSAQVTVLQVDRVINPHLWSKFTTTRKQLLMSKSNDWELLTALGLGEAEVHHQVQVGMSAHSDVLTSAYSDNVALLFHCTRENVDTILSEGLDERLGRSGGLLGKGIYFTDDPTKAVSYDKKLTLLIFAVYLGDCLDVTKQDDRVKQSLVREPRKYQDQKRNPGDLSYDSIVGRPGSANEFVIFNRYQSCPLYTVQYVKKTTIDVKPPPYTSLQNHLIQHRKQVPAFAWSPQSAWQAKVGSSKPPGPGTVSWPFYAQTLYEEMKVKVPIERKSETTETVNVKKTGEEEECPICCCEYDTAPGNWQILGCSHKVCHQCHSSLKSSGTTMSGQAHTYVKCPFCQACSGLEIGSCPDGTMIVTELLGQPAAGYENYSALRIEYSVPGTLGLRREAFLPNSPDGAKVASLLRIAWDRRITFSKGTSMTTGQQNVLVWNIHHKTSLSGGSHGYPDSTYLGRVQQELAQYNII